MGTYRVYIRHTQTVEVEAKDGDSAIDIVEEMIGNGFIPEDVDSPFDYEAEELEDGNSE